MAGVIGTGNHPKALWPGVKAWFGAMYDKHAEQYSQIFETMSSDKNYEEFVQMTGFGLAPVKDQGDGVTYTSHTQGWVKRFVHVVYGLGYITTREETEDNKYAEVGRARAGACAFSMRQTKENVHANILNRGFNSSYTGGDGKELFATDHPSKAGDWSNELAVGADLSQQSLEDLNIMVMGATDDMGMKIGLMLESLIVPRQLIYEARRILKSAQQSDTAENATNVLQNAYPKGIIMNSYLTDADAFFVKTNCPNGLLTLQRRAIEFTKDNDFDTENAKAKTTER